MLDLGHLLKQLVHDDFWLVVREEAIALVGLLIKVFESEKHYVFISSVSLAESRVIFHFVNLCSRLTKRNISIVLLISNHLVLVRLVSLLALLLSFCSVLILLVALFEIFTHLSRGGIIADLHPGVSDNVGDGETLVRVET